MWLFACNMHVCLDLQGSMVCLRACISFLDSNLGFLLQYVNFRVLSRLWPCIWFLNCKFSSPFLVGFDIVRDLEKRRFMFVWNSFPLIEAFQFLNTHRGWVSPFRSSCFSLFGDFYRWSAIVNPVTRFLPIRGVQGFLRNREIQVHRQNTVDGPKYQNKKQNRNS